MHSKLIVEIHRQNGDRINLLQESGVKIKEGLCDFLPLCISPFIKFWIPEPVFLKLGKYIMAPEPV
jgi:hypothetical protein